MTERPTPETDAFYQELYIDVPEEMMEHACGDERRKMQQFERERDEARAIAKYWQEQYGHSNPEHEWQALPWDKEGGPQ